MERNQLGPATNQFQPSLCPHFSACHFPLLLRRVHRSNNARGSLYNRSWQTPGFPASLQASSVSQVRYYSSRYTCRKVTSRGTRCILNMQSLWNLTGQAHKFGIVGVKGQREATPRSPEPVLPPRCHQLHCTTRPLRCLRLKPGNVVGQQSTAHNGTCCAVSWERVGEQWRHCARHHYTAWSPLGCSSPGH